MNANLPATRPLFHVENSACALVSRLTIVEAVLCAGPCLLEDEIDGLERRVQRGR